MSVNSKTPVFKYSFSKKGSLKDVKGGARGEKRGTPRLLLEMAHKLPTKLVLGREPLHYLGLLC
jgi:hypothetical protein